MKPDARQPRETLIPTIPQMERMGLVRCPGDGEHQCAVFVDPVNVPSKRCLTHHRQWAKQRREERERRQRDHTRRPRQDREHVHATIRYR